MKTVQSSTALVTFRGAIKITGINPYVHVSAARAKAVKAGWRKPMPVLLRVNNTASAKTGKPWRINLMPMGNGAFYLYLHGEIRKATATGVGDRVAVEIIFDSAYRNGPMEPVPTWFKGPLMKDQKAKAAWTALAPSRKKEIVRYLARLKSPEAQSRNLLRTMKMLAGEKGRFMGREK